MRTWPYCGCWPTVAKGLSRTRAQTLNRLHRLLTELIPGGAPRHLSALQAKALLAGQRPRDAAGRTRRALAAELIGEIEVLDGKLKQLNRRLRQDVTATGSRLLDLFGIGPAGAARIPIRRRRHRPLRRP
jgi:transposase